MNIKMYWKYNGQLINTFGKLRSIEPTIAFAMNGGMFHPDYSPVGLYIENGMKLKSITRSHNPNYNYGIEPQGIFLIRDSAHRKAEIVTVDHFISNNVIYATESAPMLVIDGKINPNLPKGSSTVIRNGIGILPNGDALMAVSNEGITFQDFASYFQHKGCANALYLDGGISAAYAGKDDVGGNFGVMIGVIKGRTN